MHNFKVTTDSHQDLPIAPHVLNREFNVDQPDKVWVGDITYIATDEGWLFLAVVIDLFSRQVLGWSLRADMRRDLVIDALRMAWYQRHPNPPGWADLPQRPGQSIRFSLSVIKDSLAWVSVTTMKSTIQLTLSS